MTKQLIAFVFILLCVSASAQTDTSAAQKKAKPTPPWWVQRFRVSAGMFFTVNNTVIQVGNEDGSHGTTIDFEKDLGFSKSTGTFLGSAQWRASRRSKFELNYYHIDRTSTKTLDKDIVFRDTTFKLNSSVQAFFNTDIFQFSYGYALLLNPKYEVGLSIGAHIVKAKTGIGLNTTLGNVSAEQDFGFTAPLPDIGIWGGYAISKKWAFNGYFNYLALTIGNIKGSLVSYEASVTYKILNNLSASAGYMGLDFKVDANNDKARGYLKWGYNGPSLTVNYSFGRKPW
jgi:hypothetical protein